MRRTRSTLLVLLLVVAATLTGCGGGGGGDSESTTTTTAAPANRTGDVVVTIHTFQFSPDPLEVPAGTTVRFTNDDKTTHSVTAGTRERPDPQRFDEMLAEGASTEITFDEPGRVPYFCRFHHGPGMTAEVVVT